jgi:acyl-CoA thioesterase-1
MLGVSASAGGTTASAAIANSADGNPIILVMGDSISAAYGIQREQGWVYLLEQRLKAEGSAWQVVNASLSGETTGGGLARLPLALETHQPALVVIELGGNDGLRGYPINRVRDNLKAMVELALADRSQVLLVGMQIPPNYGPRYTRSFSGMYEEIAQETNSGLVPFLLEAVALESGMMQSDGIHPTADAQPLLLDTLWPHLEDLLEDPLTSD